MCLKMQMPDGSVAMICGIRFHKERWCECGRECQFLCDWKVIRDGEKTTCDKPICAVHAKQVAPGKHLCPEHQGRYDDWKRKHNKQGNLFAEAA